MFKIKKNLDDLSERAEQVAQEAEKQSKKAKKLRGRYLIYALFLLLFCLAYLWRVFDLQRVHQEADLGQTSYQIQRQVRVPAARGSIVDRNGVPLAFSASQMNLAFAYTGLKDDELNAVLLDIARLLERYQVDYGHAIERYLDLDQMRFTVPVEDVVYWQRNRNYLALEQPIDGQVDDWTDRRYAKRDPEQFYRFLSYTKFHISPDYSDEDVRRILRLRFTLYLDNWAFTQGEPIEIAQDVPDEVVKQCEELNFRYKGAVAIEHYQRHYSDKAQLMAPVLGYVGPISAEEYQRLEKMGYRNDDIVGKAGIERSVERYLHGQEGLANYQVWEDNPLPSQLQGRQGKAEVPGANVRLTIDSRLQEVGMRELKRMIEFYDSPKFGRPRFSEPGLKNLEAQAVLLDLKHDGAVLAMLNYPTYDPEDFIRMATDKAAAARVETYLTDNENKPMLNRATMSINPPGSTFKVFTALAVMENHIVPATETIYNPGVYDVDGLLFKCEAPHQDMNLYDALTYSCNVYFYDRGIKLGIDRLTPVLKTLGLGQRSGIEVDEVSGLVPSRALKARINQNPGDQIWFPADMAQTSIGQGMNAYTVLELARAVGGIATGKLSNPHLIEEITAQDGRVLMRHEKVSQDLPFRQDALEEVRKGMLATFTNPRSSTHPIFENVEYQAGSKTGTADVIVPNEKQMQTNGIFVVFAPYDDPQVAYASNFNNGVWGASTSYLARVLLDEYFGYEGYKALSYRYDPN